MRFDYHGVVLRDILPGDKADYFRWYTTETEWQYWDAPWERGAPFDWAAFEAMFDSWLADPAKQSVRTGFEIEADGRHIGWVSSYFVEGDPARRAVGIDLPAPSIRGRGAGRAALAGLIHYLLAWFPGEAVYTQTWSGNERMCSLARRLHFQECRRLPGIREVHTPAADGRFDALTFRLDECAFHLDYPDGFEKEGNLFHDGP